MSQQIINQFHVIGMAIKTTNENGQSAKDIPALWEKFMTNQTVNKIPNKVSNDVYCIYTEYEGDHTKPYVTLLGCKVSSLENIPDGFKAMTFDDGNYKKFNVKGNLMEGVIWNEWTKIWQSDLDRTFKADFEIYGENAMDPTNAEVDIFVAIK